MVRYTWLKSLNKFINTHHLNLRTVLNQVEIVTCIQSIKTHAFQLSYMNMIADILDSSFLIILKIKSFTLLLEYIRVFKFTKVTKPMVKLLRASRYLSTIYFDDI